MENYATQLKEQSLLLEQMIGEADRRIRGCAVKDNQKICVTNRKNGFQYYSVDKDGKRLYLKKIQMPLIKAIAQRDYDLAVKKTIMDMRYHIERFLRQYDMDAIEDVYNNLCDARKVLVKPIIETDEEYIENWKLQHIGGQNSFPEDGVYLTERGEKVRSKSEKILADLFLKYEIPYTYEPQLHLGFGKVYYPDFVLLNVIKRKTIYWEHFGLITNGEYAIKAFQKMQEYENAGLVNGEDIIYSMESESMPLDIKFIEKKIEKYLL